MNILKVMSRLKNQIVRSIALHRIKMDAGFILMENEYMKKPVLIRIEECRIIIAEVHHHIIHLIRMMYRIMMTLMILQKNGQKNLVMVITMTVTMTVTMTHMIIGRVNGTERN